MIQMKDKKTNDITKLKLAYAMRNCMEKATVEDITVRQICQEGQFSRQTFYRCFSDKYDLINWYFDRILNESFRQMGKGKNIQESLILKFDYIQQERLFFRAGFASDQQNNLTEHDFQMIFSFYKNLIFEKSGCHLEQVMSDILEMYCHASVYMTVKWIMNGYQMSSGALANIMVEAMPERLETLFRKLEILK